MKKEHFMEVFDMFDQVLKNIDMEAPRKLKYLMDLFKNIKEGKVALANKDLLKVIDQIGHLTRFGGECEFLIDKKRKKIGSSKYTLNTVLFAPAAILENVEDKALLACFRAVLTLTTKWNIDTLLLEAILDRGVDDILGSICFLNSVYIDQAMIDEFKKCSFETTEIIVELIYEEDGITVDDKKTERNISRNYQMSWDLPAGVTKEGAIELTEAKFSLWNRLRSEFAYGLGL